jgi:hypothetical protein
MIYVREPTCAAGADIDGLAWRDTSRLAAFMHQDTGPVWAGMATLGPALAGVPPT